MARVRRVVSFHLFCLSPLQWLARDFKYETFRYLRIPLNKVSEVTKREQEQGQQVSDRGEAQEDYKPEKNGSGHCSTTLRSYNIWKIHNKIKRMVALYPRSNESHLTKYQKLQWENKAKEDYKPEKNGPGLTRSTLTASTCVRLYNISKMHAFPDSSNMKPFG